MLCRVLNPTDRQLKISQFSTIGVASPVNVRAIQKSEVPEQQGELTIAEMRAAIEAKRINLESTVLKGEDLDGLIKFLYRNLDVMATEVSELPGTSVLRHTIDTGNSPPLRRQAYRHSPSDKAEINKQIDELIQAGMVEPSHSPWAAPVILVNKRRWNEKICHRLQVPELGHVLDIVSHSKNRRRVGCRWDPAVENLLCDRP